MSAHRILAPARHWLDRLRARPASGGTAGARAQLLLRPQHAGPPAADNPLQWLVAEGERVIASGQGTPAEPWRTLPASFIVPAAAVSYFDLPAPPGLKPADWPLLLEEQLCVAAADLEIACVGRRDARLQLQLVDKALLQQWEQQCALHSVVPQRYVSDFQLLPAAPAGSYLCWIQPGSGELTLILPASAAVAPVAADMGVADAASTEAPAAQSVAVSSSASRPAASVERGLRWLCWPAQAELPPCCRGLQRIELQAGADELAWQPLLAGLGQRLTPLRRGAGGRGIGGLGIGSLFNGGSGSGGQGRAALALPSLRALRPALVLLLVCSFGYLGAERWQRGQQVESARQQLGLALQLPADARLERVQRALDGRLRQQQALQGQLADLTLLSDSLALWLEQQPGFRVQGYQFRDGQVQLQLATDILPLQSPEGASVQEPAGQEPAGRQLVQTLTQHLTQHLGADLAAAVQIRIEDPGSGDMPGGTGARLAIAYALPGQEKTAWQ